MSVISSKFPNVVSMHMNDLDKYVNPAPSFPCQQFVLGTIEDMSYYFVFNELQQTKYKPFLLSSATDWTEDLNNILVSCGMNVDLNNRFCNTFPQVRILVPKDLSRLINGSGEPRITVLEFSIVFNPDTISKFDTTLIDPGIDINYYILLMKRKVVQGGFSSTKHKKRILSRERVIYKDAAKSHYVKYKNKMFTLNEINAIEAIRKHSSKK